MNYSRLFLKMFVLFAFHHFGVCEIQYKLDLISMIIEGFDKTWTTISICKYRHRDAFKFSSKELTDYCGGEFSSTDIEIVILIQQTMRFTLSRQGMKFPLHFDVLFPTDVHIQMFFRDIRIKQRLDCGPRIDIEKMFTYPKKDLPDEDKTVTPFSIKTTFYVKRMDPVRFEYPLSFTFARISSRRTQEADLIIQPYTFNISHRIGDNKYVLCSNFDQFSLYVLQFLDEKKANEFFASVADYLNRDIVCANDWLTPEFLRQIDSPRMPHLPHLPYLR